jgi:uncharacterized protein DUF1259
MMRLVSLLVTVGAICASTSMASAQAIDWQKVDDAFGRKPAAVAGDAHRYGFPRTDLNVTLDGVTMHNHLLRASPATFYMHVGGHGDPVKMATAIREALALSKTPLQPPAAPAQPPAIELDTAQLDQIIGAKGQANGGVYQFGVPRRDPVTMDGMPIAPPGPMGLATGIGFQPTDGGKTAITGDFVMLASEVNPVIEALHANGIEITALHSHMLDEQPRLFFMHFWANGDAVKLAKGLRLGLDAMTNVKNSL